MKYTLPFRVRVYECDAGGRLSVPSLLNYMQEIAALHTVELHISIPELLPRGYTWMLSRIHLVADRYPAYADKLSMNTWISGHRGRFSVREFALLDASGASLMRITSSWVLYDINEHRAANVDEVIPLEEVRPERAVKDDFLSLPVPDDDAMEYRKHLQVRRSDLDINRHVNNRVTAEWALEAVPEKISKTYELAELEIAFKGQAFYGDSILSQCRIPDEKEQYTVLQHIIKSDKGRLIAPLRTIWRMKEGKQGFFA